MTEASPHSGQTSPAPSRASPAQSAASRLTSGQSWFQKSCFAASLISPLACASVFVLAKDIYVLELAADIQVMAVVGVVVAIWGPTSYVLAGYCLEKGFLSKWFPWETWGRRAPWYLTHCIACAICTALLYFPPSWDPVVLCIWYLIWGCCCAWLLAVQFTCFESARAEIYPTKEERSETESLCKITSGIGNALGLVPQLVVAANMTRLSLSLAGGSFLLVGLISLISIPVLRQARQAFNPNAVTGCFIWEYLEVIRQPAFALLCMYRFFDGAVNTLLVNGALYYYTFVSGLSGSDRSLYITVTGACQGLITVSLLPVWTIFFRKKRPVNINKVCASACTVGLVAPFVLYLLHGLLPDPWDFLVYFVLVGASFTGQTYWRSIVLCWIVDEDCQAKAGRRREAIFVGCISLISSTGRAAASGILLTALSAAGLEVSNCAAECTDTDRDVVNCREECEVQNFESQDPAVKTCIQFFYFAVIPSCQLIAVFLTWIFPIHSHRLELIYKNQEELYKPTQPTLPTAPASPRDAEATAVSPEIVETLEKPSSKIEL